MLPDTRFGKESAKWCFYLPNPPQLPLNWHDQQPNAMASIVALNGNHWRKISVIMAKISAPDDDWRRYQASLLRQDTQIQFAADDYKKQANIHLICGQQSAQKLGIDIKLTPQSFMDVSGANQTRILLPYLDYRQLPNRTINELRQYLNAIAD